MEQRKHKSATVRNTDYRCCCAEDNHHKLTKPPSQIASRSQNKIKAVELNKHLRSGHLSCKIRAFKRAKATLAKRLTFRAAAEKNFAFSSQCVYACPAEWLRDNRLKLNLKLFVFALCVPLLYTFVC